MRALARQLARERARTIPETGPKIGISTNKLDLLVQGIGPIAICARTKRDQPKGWSRVNQLVTMDGYK